MNLITKFDPWNNNLCSCPDKYSLSAYSGCGHGCLYCYASSYIRNFSSPRPKKDFLKKLAKEVTKVPHGSIITMANSSDCYQPLEEKLKLTQGALKILKNYELKINLVTKSALILRDLKILKTIKKIVVCISLTTVDERLVKILEPNCSSAKERLKTIQALSTQLPVVVRLDPLIYPLTIEKIEETVKMIKAAGAKQIITSSYKAKPDNFKKMTTAFPKYKKLWKDLYLIKGERKSGCNYLPLNLRKEMITSLRAVALSQGLKFSSCREGLRQLNTADCDGSLFLD